MKELKTALSPIQAFLNVLIASAVFSLNYNAGKKKPFLTPALSTKLKVWGTQALPFVEQYKLHTKNFQAFVGHLLKGDATDELSDSYEDVADTVKKRWALIQKDVKITADQLTMLKDCVIWMNNDSSSALSRIRKNMNRVGIATDLMEEFKVDTESQAPYLKALRPLIKKLVGRDGVALTIDETKDVRERKPELYKQYLELRRTIVGIYKNELVNLVRDNGGRPVDVKVARKHMDDNKILHRIPEGFVGLIGEDGQIYTSTGKRINGVPQFPVKMNPSYDPKTDNGNVFTVTLDSTDAAGKNNVQHFYTVDYRQAKTSHKFALVNKLVEGQAKFRKKWLTDMRSTNDETRIPATIVELSYLTAARIGTPGNATKGGRTQGLTTLEVGNVKKRGTSRVLDYIGKDGVHQVHVIAPATVENKLIIKLLDELCKNEDGSPKKRADPLFKKGSAVYSASKVRAYFKRVTGMDIGMHKIRTLRGTTYAQEILEKLAEDLSKKRGINQQMVEREFKAAVTKVGELLGHVRGIGTNQKVTWTTASQSYIDPEVQKEFFESFAKHGVRLPAFLRKHHAE